MASGRGTRLASAPDELQDQVADASFAAALDYPPDVTYSDEATVAGASAVANPHGEGNHLVGLLRAATSVAGQEQDAPMAEAFNSPTRRHDDPSVEASPSDRARKRKRPAADTQEIMQQTEGGLTAQAGASSFISGRTSAPPSQGASAASYPPALANHSAAPLFRTPSVNSKKYTRPPMSTLFTSLGLGPEGFLHLQAAAKSYMLDPQHPERRDCVGSRSTGAGAQPSEMVKLRLWNCVKDFLENEGWGERCFGVIAQQNADNEGAGEKLYWPRDKNVIISRVTPLLRRMVTNERQRLYALETRKGPGALASATPAGPSTNRKRKADVLAGSPERAGSAETSDRGYLERPQHFQPFTKRIEFDVWSDRSETMTGETISVFDAEVMSLGQQSGLPTNEFEKLVAVIEHHVKRHYYEDANSRGCEDKCHDAFFVQYFRRKGFVELGTWGNQSNKIGSARLILRALFRAINRVVTSQFNPLNRAFSPSTIAENPNRGQKRPRTAAGLQESSEQPVEAALVERYQSPYPVEGDTQPIDPAITSASQDIQEQSVSSLQQPAVLSLYVSILSPTPENPSNRLVPRFSFTTTIPTSEQQSLVSTSMPGETPSTDKSSFLTRPSFISAVRSHLTAVPLALGDQPLRLRILLPEGLKEIKTDGEWASALGEVFQTDWMDAECRIIVNLGSDG